MIEIKIEDKGLGKILDRLLKKVGDLTPVMKIASGIMHDAVEENFEQQGRPKWPGLALSTIRERQKKGYWPGKILQRRGELAASISRHFDARSATVGTNKVYGAIHQFGGKAGRGHKVSIPARPFLILAPKEINSIKKAINDYFRED